MEFTFQFYPPSFEPILPMGIYENKPLQMDVSTSEPKIHRNPQRRAQGLPVRSETLSFHTASISTVRIDHQRTVIAIVLLFIILLFSTVNFKSHSISTVSSDVSLFFAPLQSSKIEFEKKPTQKTEELSKKAKYIWYFWETPGKSLEVLPDFIKLCILSVEFYNPSFKIKIISPKINLENYLEFGKDIDVSRNTFYEKLSANHKSDLVRMALLYKYGGIYLDASILGIGNRNNSLDIYWDFVVCAAYTFSVAFC